MRGKRPQRCSQALAARLPALGGPSPGPQAAVKGARFHGGWAPPAPGISKAESGGTLGRLPPPDTWRRGASAGPGGPGSASLPEAFTPCGLPTTQGPAGPQAHEGRDGGPRQKQGNGDHQQHVEATPCLSGWNLIQPPRGTPGSFWEAGRQHCQASGPEPCAAHASESDRTTQPDPGPKDTSAG